MSVDYNDEDTDCILAEADIIIVDEPRLTLKILDAVMSPPKDDRGTMGMTPNEGSEGELWKRKGLCQGPPPSISHA